MQNTIKKMLSYADTARKNKYTFTELAPGTGEIYPSPQPLIRGEIVMLNARLAAPHTRAVEAFTRL